MQADLDQIQTNRVFATAQQKLQASQAINHPDADVQVVSDERRSTPGGTMMQRLVIDVWLPIE